MLFFSVFRRGDVAAQVSGNYSRCMNAGRIIPEHNVTRAGGRGDGQRRSHLLRGQEVVLEGGIVPGGGPRGDAGGRHCTCSRAKTWS